MECLHHARVKQAEYYNRGKKEAPVYQEGDEVLLLQKFIQLQRISSKLDYRFIGPFKVVKMIGLNAVMLDFVAGRSINMGMKDDYYTNSQIVNWSNIRAILDVQDAKKGKFDYLISWKGSTPGKNTWVSENHIPVSANSYLQTFRKVAEAQKKRKVKNTKVPANDEVVEK
ncbi:hypothetical protein PTTG_28774 [Puccinia triticina 1-1 BBBD Race 1]|uniref:Chromo domain-containing protein n=1 Tax=Puccinia triticina (isolate 1-1 / race 1 (BBBD)) TaxID=630390 RepID=A0A180G988_PUCT1|nr:hypothetical protein PTTG_28774 [Puccinia triticina 1-1 BBBD Race 1]